MKNVLEFVLTLAWIYLMYMLKERFVSKFKIKLHVNIINITKHKDFPKKRMSVNKNAFSATIKRRLLMPC